ncbi:MAG: hypothetical protein ACJAVX_000600 [Pseudoalteromonas rhizosphaerae]|jgi:hypothetical protein|uniref:DUF3192 domain-containing protein n=1 Tax=Pseudoalteromonas neustonica TaxID=1840331 RepID=A0ABY3FEX3_9GAMM|nr:MULTISPECIES: DUF3192 domain-containing protein [Pseudoalteromonas]MBB1293489.1 DUF3192 domain-containing protein [Pseudoalteromonas sp. SR41-4]MBB1301672.1 DUF3192 domain-containing protein [Pseudoalteromonas sp. SR44-8]MBB1309789.1 DUF3192 domain-containing protein [Pseudoalteromonas sp. SR41-8]MBB1396426.1 DUF3192 domain-containing protein [Pseudoalteromonas sp. SG44-8]MBB1409783.1 DUF3192 domain-containing protein [Pseudoalteromonas sp. SG44-17]|tara:strand:+ start:14203 stop:14586 length:384 start_codon:yes stop_codon:yes gene_type:complete
MFKKFFRYLILGLGVYALIATLVITFYKDDPQAMIWQDREAFNKRYIAKLSIETPTNLNTVLEYLGSPDLTFAKRDNEEVWQIIFYRTQHIKSDGITTMDECTGLLFKNGELILWGPSAFDAFEQRG